MPTEFETQYQKLNQEQKQAVDAIEGPVMVIAGPGTGKTQILTLRIANILLKTDTAPQNILALTFTESGVASMRKRLSGIIGSRAYQVNISTFHTFCNDVIKRYPEDFPRIIGSRPMTEADQVQLIESLIEETELEILKPFGDPLLYVVSILSSINTLKREGVTFAEYKKMVVQAKKRFAKLPDLYHDKGAHKGKMKGEYQKQERHLRKNEELAKLYNLYQKRLAKDRHYDYSDMIMEVLLALRANTDLLLLLQEEFQYVLVDEHQDTNNAQNRILELLMGFHDRPNLFVVGDEKQAIFRFQGASLQNFYYFKDRYPDVTLVTLKENYRSTQSILDTAHQLQTAPVKLNSQGEREEKPIRVYEFHNQSAELQFIAESIKENLTAGVDAEEIAVLYRDNKDATAISRVLTKLEIEHTVESDQDLFTDPDVGATIMLLRAVHEFGNEEALVPLLHLPLTGIKPLDTYRLLEIAAADDKALYYYLSHLERLEKLGLDYLVAFSKLFLNLEKWKKLSAKADLLTLAEAVIRDSGLVTEIIQEPNAFSRTAALNSFFSEVEKVMQSREVATLSDLFGYLDAVKRHRVVIKKRAVRESGKVRLMTMHRSKGLEFDQVYIPFAYSGHLGSRRQVDRLSLLDEIYTLTDKGDELFHQEDDDERRLFYVAVTRARQGLTISYASKTEDGRERVPSLFIEELKSELVSFVEEPELKTKNFLMVAPETGRQNELISQVLVTDTFYRRGLSVSALNNYLECPWKYFYRNLLRVPEKKSKHQVYGTAIHGALHDFFTAHNNQEIQADEKLLASSFEDHLAKSRVAKADYQELLKKGRVALKIYYDTYGKSFSNQVLTEFGIKGALLTDKIRLTGILDKLEFLDDNGQVKVVDYKTGRQRTRNEILGKTKNADGNYFRQLVFYKLLLDLYEEGKYRMTVGEIDFVEPDNKGRLKKETFEITDADTDELRKVIEQVGTEITTLAFWNSRCGDKKCEYCSLRNLMENSGK